MILLTSNYQLTDLQEMVTIIAQATAILIVTAIIVMLYMSYHEEPMYRLGYNVKINRWYIEEKHWYGYITIEVFEYREKAENMCTFYNKLK